MTRSKRRACEVAQVNVTRGREGARDVEILATECGEKKKEQARCGSAGVNDSVDHFTGRLWKSNRGKSTYNARPTARSALL